MSMIKDLQNQQNAWMTQFSALMQRAPASNCAEIQALIQNQNKALEQRLVDLWSKYDGLMKTNQDLN